MNGAAPRNVLLPKTESLYAQRVGDTVAAAEIRPGPNSVVLVRRCPRISCERALFFADFQARGRMVRSGVACLLGTTALVVSGLPSCGGPTPPAPSPPVAKTCSYSLALSTSSFSAAGGQGTATVTAASTNASDCSWKASSDQTWLALSGTTNGSAGGSFTFTAAATTQNPPDATITLSWSGSTSGNTSTKVSQTGGLNAAFVVQSQSTTPKPNTCEVNKSQKVKCIFDGSSSSPASLITTYQFSLVELKESFPKGPSPILDEPTLPSCDLFSKITADSNGVFPVTVILTVTSSDGHKADSQPTTVLFVKNGAC
jgi:hypothetical protein